MDKFKDYLNLKNIIVLSLTILLLISIILNIGLLNKKDKKVIMDENIVFFGDSLFEGYNVDEYFYNNKVVNSGISGNTTEDLLDRMKDGVFSYNPTKVHILIGVNDLKENVNEDKIINNILKIINEIKTERKNASIYIHSLYPVNEKKIDEANSSFKGNVNISKIKKLNKKLETTCLEKNITYINVYNSLLNEDGELKESYTIDGVHLNDLGYYRVTKVIEKYIKKDQF